jgi:hypothetical protein
MKKNLLDILSNSSKEADNQKIMDYLSGKLPEWEKNEVERWLAEESDLGDDALEGIMKLEGDETVRKNVDLLNRQLIQTLRSKRKNKRGSYFRDKPMHYIAIVLLLFLAVVSYIVIRKLLQEN